MILYEEPKLYLVGIRRLDTPNLEVVKDWEKYGQRMGYECMPKVSPLRSADTQPLLTILLEKAANANPYLECGYILEDCQTGNRIKIRVKDFVALNLLGFNNCKRKYWNWGFANLTLV